MSFRIHLSAAVAFIVLSFACISCELPSDDMTVRLLSKAEGAKSSEPAAFKLRITTRHLFLNDRQIADTADINDMAVPDGKYSILSDELRRLASSRDSYKGSSRYRAQDEKTAASELVARSAIIEMSPDVSFEVLRIVMTTLAYAGYSRMGLTSSDEDAPPVWIDQSVKADCVRDTMGSMVIGDTGMDADLASSLGAFGGTVGGGGAFRGTGAWGGGGEYAPADLSGIAGLGKGDKEGAASGEKSKKRLQPKVFAGDISIAGDLDRETVRRYIQTKTDQIRWCYQQELQKNPDLTGEIKMQWVILPTGFTARVKVAKSTIRNAAVERCVSDRIATWRFPAPKGGNAVQVVYPFIFRLTK